MSIPSSHSDYLVLSRGQWDKHARKEDIEAAIQKFYDWYSRNLAAGRFKPGSPAQHGYSNGLAVWHCH